MKRIITIIRGLGQDGRESGILSGAGEVNRHCSKNYVYLFLQRIPLERYAGMSKKIEI